MLFSAVSCPLLYPSLFFLRTLKTEAKHKVFLFLPHLTEMQSSEWAPSTLVFFEEGRVRQGSSCITCFDGTARSRYNDRTVLCSKTGKPVMSWNRPAASRVIRWRQMESDGFTVVNFGFQWMHGEGWQSMAVVRTGGPTVQFTNWPGLGPQGLELPK